MRATDQRILLLTGLLMALRAEAQLNRPFDPKSTLSRPYPERTARPGEALTPFPSGSGFRFYQFETDLLPYTTWHNTAFEAWYQSYRRASALHAGSFASLEVYDKWFLSIPGSGVEISRPMLEVYVRGMPPVIRAQYRARKRPPQVSAPPHDPSPLIEEHQRLRAIPVTSLGPSRVLVVSPGKIVSEGDTFTTTNRDFVLTWRLVSVDGPAGDFSLVRKLRPESPPRAAPALWTGGQIFWVFFWSMALVASIIVYVAAQP